MGGVVENYAPDFGGDVKKRCTPHFVLAVHKKARSWRKAARELNELYGVNLHHLTWRDHATGRNDIVDLTIRAALLLGPQETIKTHFLHLLKRMKTKDLNRWHELCKQSKFLAASDLLDEVYSRPITDEVMNVD